NLVNEYPEGVSERAKAPLARAEAMSVADYRDALINRRAAQAAHAAIAPLADAVITLSSPGPAPLWPGDAPGKPLAPRPTGHPVFNFPSSMLFAPAVTMPLMAVAGMPPRAQVLGHQHCGARVHGVPPWLPQHLGP